MLPFLRFFASGSDRPLLPNQSQIDQRYRRHRKLIMTGITLGYALGYTCRLGLSVVKKPLIDAGVFNAEQLGVIGSALFYAYAFGKLVNGFLADHANVKRFYAVGLLGSALINLTMGWSTGFWVWVVLWGVNGWFQGFGAPSGIVALSHWFGHRERGRFYGLWSTSHSLGEGLTFLGSAALVSWLGWRGGFQGPGMICVATAAVVYLLLQDRPQTLGLPAITTWKDDPVATRRAGQSTWDAQLSVLKLPSIWILALASATMYMTRYGMNSWGMLYLQESKGYSALQAGAFLALNPVAGVLGCIAYGYLSDLFFDARRPPMNLICGVMEVAALLVMFLSPPGHPVVLTVAFLAYGFSINGLITSLGGLFAVDIAPKQAAGAVMGFVGVFSYVGAAIQERISGLLIEHGTTFVNGIRHYDFHRVTYYWIGCSIVSLVLAASLWRTTIRN
ncbi:MAG TPA: MFS transporter [Opitutaceae bacterium]|nr:MFS transporter [Opitutaceae bacterium]